MWLIPYACLLLRNTLAENSLRRYIYILGTIHMNSSLQHKLLYSIPVQVQFNTVKTSILTWKMTMINTYPPIEGAMKTETCLYMVLCA